MRLRNRRTSEGSEEPVEAQAAEKKSQRTPAKRRRREAAPEPESESEPEIEEEAVENSSADSDSDDDMPEEVSFSTAKKTIGAIEVGEAQAAIRSAVAAHQHAVVCKFEHGLIWFCRVQRDAKRRTERAAERRRSVRALRHPSDLYQRRPEQKTKETRHFCACRSCRATRGTTGQGCSNVRRASLLLS